MKSAELGDVFEYNCIPARVIGIAEGKTLVIELDEPEHCKHCGEVIKEKKIIEVLEHSANFQQGAQPIKTIKVT